MGGDDSYSASDLRRRYVRGGSAKDSELSASQLRSRYEIENSKHGEGMYTSACALRARPPDRPCPRWVRAGKGEADSTMILLAGIVVLVVLSAAILLFKK